MSKMSHANGEEIGAEIEGKDGTKPQGGAKGRTI